MNEPGRPEYTELQYQDWLDELKPYLKLGNSLDYSIKKAGLLKHRSTLYNKYRLKDWFFERIEAYRRLPGEILNSIFARLVMTVHEKIKQDRPITSEEWHNLRFFAEKHRSCQPFFVNRTETAQTRPIEDILDELDKQGNDTIDDVAEWAKKSFEQKTNQT